MKDLMNNKWAFGVAGIIIGAFVLPQLFNGFSGFTKKRRMGSSILGKARSGGMMGGSMSKEPMYICCPDSNPQHCYNSWTPCPVGESQTVLN